MKLFQIINKILERKDRQPVKIDFKIFLTENTVNRWEAVSIIYSCGIRGKQGGGSVIHSYVHLQYRGFAKCKTSNA